MPCRKAAQRHIADVGRDNFVEYSELVYSDLLDTVGSYLARHDLANPQMHPLTVAVGKFRDGVLPYFPRH